MKTMKLFFGAAFVGAALMMTSPAFAGGLVLSKAELSTKHRSSLVQRIAKAKAQHPDAFKLVAQAPDLAVKRDQEKRGRAATITQALRSLGPDGLYPMLEMLAVDAPARGNMSDSAWTTLRVGLLEAVGARLGLELIVNTSFNPSGYPIVSTPVEALSMFARTDMDLLVLNDTVIWKQ